MGRISTLAAMLREGRRDEIRAILLRGFLPSHVFRRNELAIVRLRTPKALPRPLPAFVTRWGRPEDEPLLQRVRPRRQGYGHHFAKGRLLLLTENAGAVAAFNWFEVEGCHQSETNGYAFEFGPHGAWAFGLEVDPRFRLSGVFHKQWIEALRLLAERRIDVVYGSVQSDNPRSIASHVRLGFEVLWRYRMTRVLGRVAYVAEPGEGISAARQRGFGTWVGRDPS